MNENPSTTQLSLESLSKYRSVLMGLEILLNIIFHFAEDCRTYEIHYVGGVQWFDIYIHSSGVDMFLLLSGLGLYFSMKKGPERKAFYKKRFQKLLIPYVIVAVPAWLWLDVIWEKSGVFTFLKDISFVSFFFQEKRWFWYILMAGVCYVVFPYIFNLVEQARDRAEEKLRIMSLCLLTTVVLILLELYHHDLYVNISIAVTRFPAFFAGVLIGKAVYEKRRISVGGVAALAVSAVILAGPLGLADKSIIGVYMAGFVNFCLCLVFVLVLTRMSRSRFGLLRGTERGIFLILGWFGKYTLELYLIHVAVRRIMKTLGFYTYRLSWEGIMILISLVLALVLHRMTDGIFKQLEKRKARKVNR